MVPKLARGFPKSPSGRILLSAVCTPLVVGIIVCGALRTPDPLVVWAFTTQALWGAWAVMVAAAFTRRYQNVWWRRQHDKDPRFPRVHFELILLAVGLSLVGRLCGAQMWEWWRVGGALGLGGGWCLSFAALLHNPWFVEEVGAWPSQHIVMSGPYRHIRHPGYLSLILQALAWPLVIGSPMGWAGAIGVCVCVVRRVRVEEAALLGYAPTALQYRTYKDHVGWRLVPHVW